MDSILNEEFTDNFKLSVGNIVGNANVTIKYNRFFFSMKKSNPGQTFITVIKGLANDIKNLSIDEFNTDSLLNIFNQYAIEKYRGKIDKITLNSCSHYKNTYTYNLSIYGATIMDYKVIARLYFDVNEKNHDIWKEMITKLICENLKKYGYAVKDIQK